MNWILESMKSQYLTLNADRYRIDFVMTNPPFYASKESMLESAAAKSRPPFSACTGAEIEMVTNGGEVAFVKRIFEESKSLADRVQWFSAMLGKLDSAREVVSMLINTGQGGGINFAVKEFVQSTKTRRWAVAWSWQDRRPAMVWQWWFCFVTSTDCIQDAARGTNALGKHHLPFPSLFTFNIPTSPRSDNVGKKLDELMSSLSCPAFKWSYYAAGLVGIGSAAKNVWSRSARRDRDRNMDIDDEDEISHKPALMFRINIKLTEQSDNSQVVLDLVWLSGKDSVLFESFCGMVKRELSKNQN